MTPLSKSLIFGAFGSRLRPAPSQTVRPDVHDDSKLLAEFLAAKTSDGLSAANIGSEIQGNLRMLAPEAFHYFLPAFLYATINSYALLRDFAAELVETLTEPRRQDVIESFQRMERAPQELRFPQETIALLRKQQLEWFDSGAPTSVFHERFDDLTQAEGGVISAFLDWLKATHGADFPFAELESAADRFWSRYQSHDNANTD